MYWGAMNNKIPVFFHIFRSGGTFTISIARVLFSIFCTKFLQKYSPEKEYIIRILKGKVEVALIYAINIEGIKHKHITPTKNDTSYDLQFKNLKAITSFKIFCIIIRPDGFLITTWKHILKVLNISPEYCIKFFILRSPFDLIQSTFNYLKSENSKHEPTHGITKNISLETFIKSNYSSDSWIIRSMFKIPDNTNLKEGVFKKFLEFIIEENFYVFKLEKSIQGINRIFNICYGLTTFNLNTRQRNECKTKDHHCNYKKRKYSSLKCKPFFEQKFKHDISLYNKF